MPKVQNLASRAYNRLDAISDAQLHIAVRRWLAREIAGHVASEKLRLPYTYAVIRDALRSYAWDTRNADDTVTVISDIAPSSDVLLAIDALVKESQMPGADFPNSAGFLGPDDWYR